MRFLEEAAEHCGALLKVGGTMESWRPCSKLKGTVEVCVTLLRLWNGLGYSAAELVVL